MQSLLPAVLVFLGAVFVTGALHAQHGPIAPTATVLSTAAGLRLPQTLALHSYQQAALAEASYRRPNRRQGEILMIVGGAVILTGLLVDEGLIAIAGAAIGGYGLYVYLRASDRER